MDLKSYSKKEIIEKVLAGEDLWRLDTGNDGEDDVLYGEYGAVLDDILYHYDIDELPKHWSLDQVTIEVENGWMENVDRTKCFCPECIESNPDALEDILGGPCDYPARCAFCGRLNFELPS